MQLPHEAIPADDRNEPTTEAANEARAISTELLQEILETRLGYASYFLTDDLGGHPDLNIPFDGVQLTEYAHALIVAIDTGIQEGRGVTSPYCALPAVEWFRLANALLAAIVRGVI